MNISPADAYSNQGMTLDVYSVPTTGGSTKVDTAGANKLLTMKRALFNMNAAGSYVVVVNNWDALGRTVHYDLDATFIATGLVAVILNPVSPAAAAAATAAPAATATAAPAATATAAPAATATAAPAATATAAPAATATTASATVSGHLATKGSSGVFRIASMGDGTKVRLTMNISPADTYSNDGMTLEVYSLPTSGGSTRVDTAGKNKLLTNKRALFNMSAAGSYIVVVTNWDPLGRPLHYDLDATFIATGLAAAILTPVAK
ncbi:MAG: hypothetical protein Q7R39_08315 [Dehalococcoidia bacterium]|nr:hypothetical protein [Dehalococcoidia bacterium]